MRPENCEKQLLIGIIVMCNKFFYEKPLKKYTTLNNCTDHASPSPISRIRRRQNWPAHRFRHMKSAQSYTIILYQYSSNRRRHPYMFCKRNCNMSSYVMMEKSISTYCDWHVHEWVVAWGHGRTRRLCMSVVCFSLYESIIHRHFTRGACVRLCLYSPTFVWLSVC